MNLIKREILDYKILLRNVPSLVISIFILSVVLMNLFANKELINYKYLALDCGFTLSWISFLAMDMLCKRFGARAAFKISLLALFINLIVTLVFKLLTLAPGMWGEYYSTGLIQVNEGLNATIGGTWFVVLGSSIAMFVASITNTGLNHLIAKRLKKDNFKSFAIRSYTSTGIAQLLDNLVFATIVSHTFFGWTWIQVIVCAFTGAVLELICEVIFSPVGYKISKEWAEEKVGEDYLHFKKAGVNNV